MSAAHGGQILLSSATYELVRAQRGAGTIVGILSLSHQVGSTVGATATGVLYQLTGSYDVAILYAIALLVVASILSFALPAESRQAAIPATA